MHAIIASPIGTARMPTQGSCLPFVIISLSVPSLDIVCLGVKIDEVGFTAKRTIRSCPVLIPPKTPPELLLLYLGWAFS